MSINKRSPSTSAFICALLALASVLMFCDRPINFLHLSWALEAQKPSLTQAPELHSDVPFESRRIVAKGQRKSEFQTKTHTDRTNESSPSSADSGTQSNKLQRLSEEPRKQTALTKPQHKPSNENLYLNQKKKQQPHNSASLGKQAISTKAEVRVELEPGAKHRGSSGDSDRARRPEFGNSNSSRATQATVDLDATVDTSESNRVEQNSECALILRRTYILKESDQWGDKFVFEDIDTDDKKIHKSELCIKHTDVDKAIEEAKHKLKFEQPDDLDSLEVSEGSIAAVAELNLATAKLLTDKFDLSHDEILNALPMIDMSASKFFWKDLCPKHVRPMMCSKSRYRSITAHCSNLKHPSWGATNTPYSRYLPPDYADGLTMPRASHTGEPLPSARLITSVVHRDEDEPSNDYSILFADWGQVLNHDVTRAALGQGELFCLTKVVFTKDNVLA